MSVAPGGDSAGDALAAQVRRFPGLPLGAVGRLLAEARADPQGDARRRLAEHHLDIALRVAVARGRDAASVEDLFQEASVAVMVAVSDHVRDAAPPDLLRARIESEVARSVDESLAQLDAARRGDEAMAADAQLLEAGEQRLRRELGRPPSTEELALALGWPLRRLTVVTAMVSAARALNDEDISLYLDDEEG